MPTVRLTAFGGTQPRTAARLLPDNGALRAENVKLQSGELRPLNQPRLVYTQNKPMPPKTIYRARNGASAGWMSWPFDVDVVRAPLPSDVESRYYWTGDGEPRMAEHTEAISGGDDDYPKTFFALGVPAPQAKPTVTPSGGTSSTVTRFYCVTFFSEKAEESSNSPISLSASGKVDGTWLIENMAPFPLNSGTGTATHSGGVTTFTNGGSVPHWLRREDPIVIGGNAVVVSEIISPTVFKVIGDYSAQTSWARAANWNITGMKRRLYRTTGTSGSWQLVADDVGTSYTDSLTDSQILGDELISEGWIPPPAGLKGLCVHSSGALCGFVGTLFCASEPMQPHAWPESYQLSTDYPIVGSAPFGSSIALATEGNPYVADGVEPVSMSMQKIDGLYPCVSKRSVISVGDGALYASNHGLLYIGQSGVRVFTDAYYTRDEWLILEPPSMICEYANGRVYCAFLTGKGGAGILVFDGGVHTTVGIAVSELYADQSTGYLYIGTGEGISLYDPEEQSYPMATAWRSKEFVFPAPCNLGAAKIDFKVAIDPVVLLKLNEEQAAQTAKNAALLADGGFFGAVNFTGYNERGVNGSEAYYVPPIPPTNDVQFILRVGDQVVFNRVVKDAKAFRLPAGIKYDHCSIEVAGQGIIYDVRAAETMSGLKVT